MLSESKHDGVSPLLVPQSHHDDAPGAQDFPKKGNGKESAEPFSRPCQLKTGKSELSAS